MFDTSRRSLSAAVKQWMSASPSRQVLNVTFTIAWITAVTKVFYLAKDLLVANVFGRSDELDAFLIAYVMPTFIINVMTAQLGAALIPAFIHQQESRGREQAHGLLANVMAVYILLLAGVAALVAVGAPYFLPFLATGFGEQKILLTRQLTTILAFNILFSGIAALWRAVLNATEQFAFPAATAAGTPIGMIAFLVLFPHGGVYSLALGMVVGIVLETAGLAWCARRVHIPLLPAWGGMYEEVRHVLRQYGLLMAGAVLMAATDLVDQSMAAALPSGSVAALSYGSKLPSVPISLIIMALGTAVLPFASKLVSAQNWHSLRSMLRRYLWLIFATTIPFTLAFAFLSEPIIRLVFQRGAFTSSDTSIVAQVQALYVLQIPFMTAYILVSRLISSMRQNAILMWVAGTVLAAKIGLNALMVHWLGVAGIALSTTVVYFLSFFLNWIFLLLRLNRLEHSPVETEVQ
jgi:putative peptidoglycan lipid II flippase